MTLYYYLVDVDYSWRIHTGYIYHLEKIFYCLLNEVSFYDLFKVFYMVIIGEMSLYELAGK